MTITLNAATLDSMLNAEFAREVARLNAVIASADYDWSDEPVHNHIALERHTLVVTVNQDYDDHTNAVEATVTLSHRNLDKSRGFPNFGPLLATSTLTVYLNESGWHTTIHMHSKPTLSLTESAD